MKQQQTDGVAERICIQPQHRDQVSRFIGALIKYLKEALGVAEFNDMKLRTDSMIGSVSEDLLCVQLQTWIKKPGHFDPVIEAFQKVGIEVKDLTPVQERTNPVEPRIKIKLVFSDEFVHKYGSDEFHDIAQEYFEEKKISSEFFPNSSLDDDTNPVGIVVWKTQQEVDDLVDVLSHFLDTDEEAKPDTDFFPVDYQAKKKQLCFGCNPVRFADVQKRLTEVGLVSNRIDVSGKTDQYEYLAIDLACVPGKFLLADAKELSVQLKTMPQQDVKKSGFNNELSDVSEEISSSVASYLDVSDDRVANWLKENFAKIFTRKIDSVEFSVSSKPEFEMIEDKPYIVVNLQSVDFGEGGIPGLVRKELGLELTLRNPKLTGQKMFKIRFDQLPDDLLEICELQDELNATLADLSEEPDQSSHESVVANTDLETNQLDPKDKDYMPISGTSEAFVYGILEAKVFEIGSFYVKHNPDSDKEYMRVVFTARNHGTEAKKCQGILESLNCVVRVGTTGFDSYVAITELNRPELRKQYREFDEADELEKYSGLLDGGDGSRYEHIKSEEQSEKKPKPKTRQQIDRSDAVDEPTPDKLVRVNLDYRKKVEVLHKKLDEGKTSSTSWFFKKFLEEYGYKPEKSRPTNVYLLDNGNKPACVYKMKNSQHALLGSQKIESELGIRCEITGRSNDTIKVAFIPHLPSFQVEPPVIQDETSSSDEEPEKLIVESGPTDDSQTQVNNEEEKVVLASEEAKEESAAEEIQPEVVLNESQASAEVEDQVSEPASASETLEEETPKVETATTSNSSDNEVDDLDEEEAESLMEIMKSIKDDRTLLHKSIQEIILNGSQNASKETIAWKKYDVGPDLRKAIVSIAIAVICIAFLLVSVLIVWLVV